MPQKHNQHKKCTQRAKKCNGKKPLSLNSDTDNLTIIMATSMGWSHTLFF